MRISGLRWTLFPPDSSMRRLSTEASKLPELSEVRDAQERIQGAAIRTPLVRLGVDHGPEIWLKLENLQPIGSFKIRGAANAMGRLTATQLAEGVWTASAGNMAQGLAWNARRLGIPCSVVVPETAPQLKLEAIARLEARATKTSVERWFEVFSTRQFDGMNGRFLHAFMDSDVMAGNGTIGMELLEDLEGIDSVVVPFGGGGLACGIAATLAQMAPGVRAFAAEVAGQAPLAVSLRTGEAVSIDYEPSFVDGIGGPHVEPEMWVHSRQVLEGSCEVTLEETADAIRLLVARNRIVAEGAAGAAVAAALSGRIPGDRIVCIVSGGNLDPTVLADILLAEPPTKTDT